MAWTTPRTWSTGETVTAAMLNEQIRDNSLYLYAALVPAGVITAYGGASAPSGWLLCDGTAVNRTTYATLFGVISTTFGVGDGSTTFNLPDLKQRFPIGKATAGTGSTLGATGGTIDHYHTQPGHTHTFTSASNGAHTHGFTTGTESSTSGVASGSDYNVADSNHTHSGTTASDGAHTHTGTTDSNGGNDTGTANPPFQVVNFIIKT